jgi:hypothetical protein
MYSKTIHALFFSKTRCPSYDSSLDVHSTKAEGRYLSENTETALEIVEGVLKAAIQQSSLIGEIEDVLG